MDPDLMGKVKKIWGWTDEQLKSLSSKHERLIEKGDQFRNWRLVAEVLEARNCIAGLKQGNKYVFHGSGFLIPEESTCQQICLWALASFVPFSFMLYDRIGQDNDPSEFWIDRVRCLDVGIERGGYGEALFRMYCMKMAVSEFTLKRIKSVVAKHRLKAMESDGYLLIYAPHRLVEIPA